MAIFSSLVSVANLVLACLLLSFSLVESRLSQLEGVRARAKVPQVYQNLDVNQQQQQQQNAIAVASESAVGSVANGNFAATAACADGWLNFQNMLCFYGIQQPQLTFYYGRQQCAQMGANFTSINSMDEFNFIMANFDLRRFWIGIAFGSNNFEDGTPVDQQVVREWAPLVPWSDPSLPKGFICKAFANMQMQSNGQSSTK